MKLDDYFSEKVMSVHLKVGVKPQVKQGAPGAWELKILERRKEVEESDLVTLVSGFQKQIEVEDDAFLEAEAPHIQVFQLGDKRTVVTYPPLSSTMEITVVRPVKKLALEEYDLDEALKERLRDRAEGVLIAGAPGNGKTTFAQALLELYYAENKIIKTIEVPRDLHVPDGVTQYSLSHSTTNAIRDLLLLTRPDYTFFDEIRNPEDFLLYKDLRLTGIGMVGVVHAERAIDALQRFIGKIELGMISHVIDTIIFIKEGGVKDVYTLKYCVKTPLGMNDSDLARPVIQIMDFFTNKELFEVYTFGDQVVVIDAEEAAAEQADSILLTEGLSGVAKFLKKQLSLPFDIEARGMRSIEVHVDEREMPSFIGKGGSNIRQLEKALGLHIDVKKKEGGVDTTKLKKVKHEVRQGKKGKVEIVPLEAFDRGILYVDKRRQYEVAMGRKGTIKIQKGMMSSIVQRGNYTLFKLK